MKKITRYILVALVSVLACSCLKDLNTVPLDETVSAADDAYSNPDSYMAGLAYINAYYNFVSPGDAGASDLDFDDAGQSELVRQWTNLNELSVDTFKCTWGDDYVSDIQYDKWTTADNAALVAVYTRCMKGVTLVNEYLAQTTPELLEQRGQSDLKATVEQYRAEARFHRAMFYWILLDCYGNPPFATYENISQGTLPKQLGRKGLYEWLVKELEELAASEAMPAYGAVPYPRATKGSVNALLAEIYLNAEVYTRTDDAPGTPEWQKAKDAAEAVIGMGYSLEPVFENLWKQDNTTNGSAEKEFIFAVDYDKDHAQSWGGTTTLASAFMSADVNQRLATLLGVGGSGIIPENWNGYHVSNEYVNNFELVGVDWTGKGFGYDRENSDKRAFLINEGIKEFDKADVSSGWRCWKFSGLYTDGHVNDASVDNYKFSSMDYPIFRLAEMYLIYAEADARLNNGVTTDSKAVSYVKALRDRAGVGMPDSITLDFLLAERARELMLEGHRRTDLIRYGYFTSMQFPWPYKAGVKNGKATIPAYMQVYPIILSDRTANTSLKQNSGY
ncbi:MAG: RagB/SusD family nutrient uptake outer membrane protein [Bacteroidales bacterium]|nr:RagB/SusD family nutrient uptake outer membrane protein [Bacteroidales bacterium]